MLLVFAPENELLASRNPGKHVRERRIKNLSSQSACLRSINSCHPMQAIKLKTHIGQDHRIELDLPSGLPEGEVEVIVLVPDAAPNQRGAALRAFFDELDRCPRQRLTKEEIDRQIAEERASWD